MKNQVTNTNKGKFLRLSNSLVVLGILFFLLVSIDRFCFKNSLLEGQFWAPSIALKTQLIDFGNVTISDDVHREVVVDNTGRSSLVLEKVLPSCSNCIIIHFYTSEPIPPGKQGKIDFSLNLENKQGKMRTSFVILSNAKPDSVVAVNVTANVLSEKP